MALDVTTRTLSRRPSWCFRDPMSMPTACRAWPPGRGKESQAMSDTRPSVCISRPGIAGGRPRITSTSKRSRVKKKISLLIAGTAVSVLVAVGPATPASAAHCVAPATEPSSPGFSTPVPITCRRSITMERRPDSPRAATPKWQPPGVGDGRGPSRQLVKGRCKVVDDPDQLEDLEPSTR